MSITWKDVIKCIQYYQRKTVPPDIVVRSKIMTSFSYSNRFISHNDGKEQIATLTMSYMDGSHLKKICKFVCRHYNWKIKSMYIDTYRTERTSENRYMLNPSDDIESNRDILDTIHPDLHTVFEYMITATMSRTTKNTTEENDNDEA